MIRTAIYYLVPLLLPTVIYVLWMLYARFRARAVPEGEMPSWERTPWILLFGSGVVLAAGVLFTIAFITGGQPGDDYEPARLEDGRIVPGRID